MTPTIGFIYQCHKQDLALFNCLARLRNYYVTEPIYLMCDNGNDYSRVANHFNCKYVHHTDSIDVRFIKDGVGKDVILDHYRKYLHRMIDGFNHLTTDYVMRVEDDTYCQGRIWHIPNYDIIGAINCYMKFWEPSNISISMVRGDAHRHNKKDYYSNAVGGCLFKRTSFLYYAEYMLDNFEFAEYLYDISPRNYTTVDVIDSLGMLLLGYNIGTSLNIYNYGDEELLIFNNVKIFNPYKKDYDKECDLNELIAEDKKKILL